MKRLRSTLADPRRSQRGSVLSGVLIMTAFIAIIAGALMTELSTNFLLSRNLMTRINNEATVNSAAELAIDQLQTTPLSSGCPALSPASVNGLTAAASFVSCFPTVDARSAAVREIASTSNFNVDATRASISRAALNLYVAGDSSGNLYQFSFGSSVANWSVHLSGAVAGPPLTAADMGEGDINDLVTLVPLAATPASPSACAAGGCVTDLASDGANPPDATCYMAANGPVQTSPAIGVTNPTIALFGDRTGSLFAYHATETAGCAAVASAPSVGQPVVAGPIVFAGPTTGSSATDELYVVTSDGQTSWLIRYTFTSKSNHPAQLEEVASLELPFPNAVGLAADSATLPARFAIGFAGGGLAVVDIQAGFGMQPLAQGQLPTGESDAPLWCHCPGGVDRIAVGGANGALYVLSSALALQAASSPGRPAITTTPGTDGVGDWFFGASDGYVHELQPASSPATLSEVAAFGSIGGAAGSGVQVGTCSTGICIYVGAANGGAYMVPLDARDVVITTCISASLPACSGSNPHLWTKLEVGSASGLQTVHVEGWSYYSG